MTPGSPRWPKVAIACAVLVVAVSATSAPHFGGARWTLHEPDSPPPTGATRTPPSQSAPDTGRPAAWHLDLLWIWLPLGVLLIAGLAWWWLRARPARPALSRATVAVRRPEPDEPEPDVPAMQSGVERALLQLDEEYEPADAVLRAWLGVQESAEQSAIVRSPSETPTEFTTRITSRAFVDDRPIRILLRLYLQVRFGQHEVTASDVATVRSALQDLVATWNVPESGRAPRPREEV